MNSKLAFTAGTPLSNPVLAKPHGAPEGMARVHAASVAKQVTQ